MMMPTMMMSRLQVLLLLPLLVTSYGTSSQLAFLYDESSGISCNNGYAISDLFVGCSLVASYNNNYQNANGYNGGYSASGTGGIGKECHMGDTMTVRGKITSTKSGIPLNAAVRFHACNTGWSTFFQTTCVELGSKYINTCTAMYGMNPLSNSVCADVGTYDFYSTFTIPQYDNILHKGKRLAITTEFDFNDQLLTECKSHINTITSTRRNGSSHFGWSMGIVALAAAAMALVARKKRQLAAEHEATVDKSAFVEMAHQADMSSGHGRNALV